MAGTTGLEPATSAVTGQRSNQLSYVPKLLLQQLQYYHVKRTFATYALLSAVVALICAVRDHNLASVSSTHQQM
jgi:hypothetical protein